MDRYTGEKMKAMAAEQQTTRAYDDLAQAQSGMLADAMAMDACGRPSVTQRARDAAYRSQQQASTAGRMKELVFLLEKNPEVARILDLIEEVKY